MNATLNRLRLDLILMMIGHLRRRLRNVTLPMFMVDVDEQDLTAYRLAVIGETVNKLPPELRVRYADVPWAAMYTMRNIISHDYPGIDMTRVYLTATGALGTLERACTAELNAID